MDNALRYFGSAVGFGIGAVWMTVGLGSAIVCLLLAALAYGAVFVAERAQANATMPRWQNRASQAEDAQRADAFEDQGGYESADDDASTPLAAEAEYGWPWPVENPELAAKAGPPRE